MKLIVGLGNPGSEYTFTRHNVGFMILDELASQLKVSWSQARFKAEIGVAHLGSEKILLVKPMTFMNLSGEAVLGALRFYKQDIEDLLVIYDDLDLDLGRMKLVSAGASGGHRGIESIIGCLSTRKFNRLRVGISRPPSGWDAANYVLSAFRSEDQDELRSIIQSAQETVTVFIKRGLIQAQNQCNRKKKSDNSV